MEILNTHLSVQMNPGMDQGAALPHKSDHNSQQLVLPRRSACYSAFYVTDLRRTLTFSSMSRFHCRVGDNMI